MRKKSKFIVNVEDRKSSLHNSLLSPANKNTAGNSFPGHGIVQNP